MNKLLRYPVKALLVLLSWFPWKVKQGLAFVLFLVLRYLLQYRKSVVRENLENSFPHLSKRRLKEISRQFYLHLAQIAFETVAINPYKKLNSSRLTIEWPEMHPSFMGDSRGVIVLGGHTANWEWYSSALRDLGYVVYAVYKPQASRLADETMLWLRSYQNIHLVPMKETYRFVKKAMSQSDKFAFLLVSDQTPAKGDINYWYPFLNQETPWFTGGEKLALKFVLPVVYLHTEKRSFGKYRFRIDPILGAGKPSSQGYITIQYVEKLQKNIEEQPFAWLWSHRRWKYKPEPLSLKS